MQITPGYDFTVNEVPNHQKLDLMAAGMSITGIDISQISTNLVGQKFAANTNMSLPAEGWLNYDQIGRIWVQTRFGEVCLSRGNWGGWETRRYRTGAVKDTYTYPINNVSPIGELVSTIAGDTNESNVCYRPGTSSVGRYVVKNMESAASGIHTRYVGRGGHWVEVLTTNRTNSPDYIVRSGSGQQDQACTPYPAISSGAGLVRKQAIALRHSTGAVRALAWWLGYETMQD